MDIQQFIEKRPFLYHLTCSENATNIIATRQLLSANELIRLSGNPAYSFIRRKKRDTHQEIIINGTRFFLRDQHPISEKNLVKCLTDGWDIGDFLNHLNQRVFMWPSVPRLWQHFKRYKSERPVLLRFSTAEMLAANPHVKFCRLNSGATRSHHKYHGAPPVRGAQSFLPAAQFDWSYRDVAEVTFEGQCVVAGHVATATNPNGPFNLI